MRPGPIALTAALLAALAAPGRARAAACCGSGHGVGPLLADAERAALTLGLGASLRVGQWSYRGEFRSLSGGDFDREIRAEIGWIVRAGQSFQLGVTAPAIYTFKQTGDLASSGGGAGDVTAFARYEIVPSRASRPYPGVALTLSTLLPTGRSAERSRDPLGADATGLGVAEIRPGIALEKRWDFGLYATAAASIGIRTVDHLASGALVAAAPRLQLFGALGPFWDMGLSTSLGILFEREAAPSIGGVAAAGAARARTAAVAFVAYDLDPRWTAVASATIDLPIRGLGQNEPLAVAPILGVRRVWGTAE